MLTKVDRPGLPYTRTDHLPPATSTRKQRQIRHATLHRSSNLAGNKNIFRPVLLPLSCICPTFCRPPRPYLLRIFLQYLLSQLLRQLPSGGHQAQI